MGCTTRAGEIFEPMLVRFFVASTPRRVGEEVSVVTLLAKDFDHGPDQRLGPLRRGERHAAEVERPHGL